MDLTSLVIIFWTVMNSACTKYNSRTLSVKLLSLFRVLGGQIPIKEWKEKKKSLIDRLESEDLRKV